MKILWFSVTPLSLNAKENTGIEGKGWISSLLQIALAIDGLELVVVYENYSPHRKEIEETAGRKVFLNLQVKVIKDWRKKSKDMEKMY